MFYAVQRFHSRWNRPRNIRQLCELPSRDLRVICARLAASRLRRSELAGRSLSILTLILIPSAHTHTYSTLRSLPPQSQPPMNAPRELRWKEPLSRAAQADDTLAVVAAVAPRSLLLHTESLAGPLGRVVGRQVEIHTRSKGVRQHSKI